jgi:hypothetical protein
MKAMLGISLYSCPYLNKQKCYVFLIIAISTRQWNWRKAQDRFCLEVGGGAEERNDPNNVRTCE